MKRIEDSLKDLWENIKYTNIRIIGIPEEEKRKGTEKIFEEITVENFPNMGKEIVNQVQEAQKFERPVVACYGQNVCVSLKSVC